MIFFKCNVWKHILVYLFKLVLNILSFIYLFTYLITYYFWVIEMRVRLFFDIVRGNIFGAYVFFLIEFRYYLRNVDLFYRRSNVRISSIIVKFFFKILRHYPRFLYNISNISLIFYNVVDFCLRTIRNTP